MRAWFRRRRPRPIEIGTLQTLTCRRFVLDGRRYIVTGWSADWDRGVTLHLSDEGAWRAENEIPRRWKLTRRGPVRVPDWSQPRRRRVR